MIAQVPISISSKRDLFSILTRGRDWQGATICNFFISIIARIPTKNQMQIIIFFTMSALLATDLQGKFTTSASDGRSSCNAKHIHRMNLYVIFLVLENL